MKPLQALLALFACAVLPLHAAGLDDLSWRATGGEVTITNCRIIATGELVIPDTIGGIPVTSIERFAFHGCLRLTSITIPDSVTSIGERAFYDCRSLTSITIPDSVTSIGVAAFRNCRSLTSITIPDGVTRIWNGVFLDCLRLTSITIPDSVTSIGHGAFVGCRSLTSITIPEGVTSIEGAAFVDCRSLTSITIPDSVTSIGIQAFSNCSSLTSITIPEGVTSIGDDAFRNCSSLTNITFLGTAPAVGVVTPFFGVSEEAQAIVQIEFAQSFGGFGSTWEGLTVAIQRATATITDCGFVNATTFFIEFEPAGAGYRVMSSPTLDFGNAAEVAPTLEPTSTEDNRFEFAASGSRNFYRLEPTE